jgi:pyruvate formate lyase activating enzyme
MNGDGTDTDGEQCTVCGACVEVCYSEARETAGREVTVAQLLAEIERDIAFYDESGGGVTVSGGEPLLQTDFLLALLRACKQQEIHTALDTCGHSSWEALDSIREYVDVFLYDLKMMDDRKHRTFTGVSNRVALSNLQALSQEGHSIVVRVPLIPGINDDDENIRETGTFAAGLASLERVDLLAYHATAIQKYTRFEKHYELPETRPPSDEQMTNLAQTLRGFGLQVQIGG